MTIAMLGNVKAEDDFFHEIESAPNFSESALFHYTARNAQGELLGGLIRVANRPNEGYAECTVLALLPDGSALFNFERPKVTGNKNWQVSGWNIEVLKHGGKLFRSRYEGEVLHLADPAIMENPREGFKSSRVKIKFDLHHAGKSPMSEFRHMRPWKSETGEVFEHHRPWISSGGYHQLMKTTGTIEIEGGEVYHIDGFGWRDHNWGPRNWQGFTDHDFLTGNLSQEEGFCLYTTIDGHGHGFHRGEGVMMTLDDLTIETEFKDDPSRPHKLWAEFSLENGEKHTLVGEQKGHMPLRNRRDGRVTKIGYSIWDYSLDGRPGGMGLGEFMRQGKE